MADNVTTLTGQLTSLPIGELFRTVAMGIAEAQAKLDESSMAVAELMSGTRVAPDGTTQDTRVYFGGRYDAAGRRMVPERVSMMELGFTPTFYQFVDTVIELKLAMVVTKTESVDQVQKTSAMGAAAPKSALSISATPVDAGYAASFNFKAEFSCTVKTSLVPIPPPPLLEERIQRTLEATTARQGTAGLLSGQSDKRPTPSWNPYALLEVKVGRDASSLGIRLFRPMVFGVPAEIQSTAAPFVVPIVRPDRDDPSQTDEIRAEQTAANLASALNNRLADELIAEHVPETAQVRLTLKIQGTFVRPRVTEHPTVNSVKVSTWDPASKDEGSSGKAQGGETP